MNEFMVMIYDWFASLLEDWGNGLASLLDSQLTILGSTYSVLDLLALRPIWDMIESLVEGWQ